MKFSGSNIILFFLAALAGIITFFLSAEAEDVIVTNPLNADGLSQTRAEAVFAGGCFWCLEADFDKVKGVVETISGYTGGAVENPTYKQVSYTETGHYEAVKVTYDPKTISYSELVEYFWRQIDPMDAGGQFCDRGSSYRTAIFPGNSDEARIAGTSKDGLQASGLLAEPIVTDIKRLTIFWPAEDYHQDYYLKNRLNYTRYRRGCGRDARLEQVWGKESGEPVQPEDKIGSPAEPPRGS